MLALLFLLCVPALAAIPDQIGALAIGAQGCITTAIFQCGCAAADFECACRCPTFKPFSSSCFDTSCTPSRASTALSTISSVCAVLNPPTTPSPAPVMPTSTPTPTLPSTTAPKLSPASTTVSKNSTSLTPSAPVYPKCTLQAAQSGSFVVCTNSSLSNGTGAYCTSGLNQTCAPIQSNDGSNTILMWSSGVYLLVAYACCIFL